MTHSAGFSRSTTFASGQQVIPRRQLLPLSKGIWFDLREIHCEWNHRAPSVPAGKQSIDGPDLTVEPAEIPGRQSVAIESLTLPVHEVTPRPVPELLLYFGQIPTTDQDLTVAVKHAQVKAKMRR